MERVQLFLSKRIEFELDKNGKLSDTKKYPEFKCDSLRYIQRLFHNYLITKTGYKYQKVLSPLTDINFKGIRKEKIIIPQLRKYLFTNIGCNENVHPKYLKIDPIKIKLLYPNLTKFTNQDDITINLQKEKDDKVIDSKDNKFVFYLNIETKRRLCNDTKLLQNLQQIFKKENVKLIFGEKERNENKIVLKKQINLNKHKIFKLLQNNMDLLPSEIQFNLQFI